MLSTKNLTAKGGIGSSAIYFSSNFEVLEGASATVISGSDEKYAITHLKNATHSFDDDVIVSFFDNSTRVVFESKSAFQYGDINEDGDVNSNDIVLLAQIIAKWNVDVSSKGLAAADVVKDGVLDSADAVLLAQFIAKWDVTLGQ